MDDEFYFLMCNYNKKGYKKIFKYEGIFSIKGNVVTRYGLGDQVIKNSRVYYLLPPTSEQSFTVQSHQNIIKEISSHFEDIKYREQFELKLQKSTLNAGEYYSNIYRPFISNDFLEEQRGLPKRIDITHVLLSDDVFFEDREYLSRLNQLELLVEELDKIFKNIEPVKANMKSYGHKIRNIMMLACTEIDSMCKNILEVNGYQHKGMYKTNDYVKLKDALKLNKYRINYIRYPEIGDIAPFRKWSTIKPTKSLKWYNDYNAIKHDRIIQFKLATLENAVSSIAAVAVLIIAQYGINNNYWKDKLDKYFFISEFPSWQYPDLYIPIIRAEGALWKPVRHNFS